MTEIDKSWPLWQFKVPQEGLFDALNDREVGIALVETPDHINPQGLVSRCAEIIRLRNCQFSIHGRFYLNGASSLMTQGFFDEKDHEAVKIGEEIDLVFGAIEKIAEENLLPHTTMRTRLNSTRRFMAITQRYAQDWHQDSNFLTAFLGATRPGHIMRLHDGEEVPLTHIPPHYVLFTQQREWCYLHPEFNIGGGITHKVEWEPHSATDLRMVGLDFIGK